MEIIAFEAKTEKGIIKIPRHYLKSIPPHVQVIIVIEEKKRKEEPKVEFKALSVDTKRLNPRDEASQLKR